MVVSTRRTFHVSYLLMELLRTRCLTRRPSGRRLWSEGVEHTRPILLCEPVGQSLGELAILDVGDGIIVALVCDAPVVELPRDALVAIRPQGPSCSARLRQKGAY
jgi:hypothetical protein